jgi:hypothetical protein
MKNQFIKNLTNYLISEQINLDIMSARNMSKSESNIDPSLIFEKFISFVESAKIDKSEIDEYNKIIENLCVSDIDDIVNSGIILENKNDDNITYTVAYLMSNYLN